MRKKITLFFVSVLFFFGFQNAQAQFESASVKIIDNIGKAHPSNPDRRSADNPTTCVIDTIEYARFKASNLQTVTAYEGRGLAQFYGAPQKLTLYGADFFAFATANVPTTLTTQVYVNLYRAGSDSLPTGTPLRSDTITIDSTFGNGLLSALVKHAKFTPIDIDFDYIIAVETKLTDTLRVGIVANNWNNGDGRGNFFNCGSISGVWYRGRNLNIGNVTFDADMLINPHVKYTFGADFEILSQCFETGTQVRFINKSSENVVSSIFYNRYAFNNQEMFSHRWNYDLVGTPFNGFVAIDGQTTYYQNQPYQVRLITSVLQWTNARFCYDTTVHTIYPKPNTPSLFGGGIKCEGDDASLFTNAPNGTNVKWMRSNTDTSGFYTGDTLIAQNLSSDTILYARVSNGECLSNPGSVSMQVYKYPAPPFVKNDSICGGSRATLLALSPGSLSIHWFKDSSTNFPFHSGPIYQSQVLNSDTFFFVRASNYSCVSEGFVKIMALVSIDFAPQEPIYSGDTSVCGNTNPLITLRAETPTTDVLRWFDQPSGGNPVGTGTTFTFSPVDKGTYNYFVEAWNGSCGSSRIIATVEVDNAPAPTLIQNAEICAGQNALLRATVPYGQISWYETPTGGSPISLGSDFNLIKLFNDSSLYVETSSGICISNNRTKVNAIVNTPANFNYLTGDTICSKGFAILKAGVPYGEILWYDNLSDTLPLGFGNTYQTPPLLGTKPYYAVSRFKGCLGEKTSVSPLVRSRPFSGFFFDVMTDQRVQLTPLTTNGVSSNWDFGDGNTSTQTAPIHRYDDSGTYNIRLILTSVSNGCKDTTTNSIYIELWDNISVLQINPKEFKIYPNPSTSYFMVESGKYSGNVDLQIFDLNGKIVFNESLSLILNETFRIEHNLNSGLYFVKIENTVFKILVE